MSDKATQAAGKLYEELERLRAEVAALKGNAEPYLYFDPDTYQISRVKPNRSTYIPLYTSTSNVPEGWVMVPKEPTPEMVAVDRFYSQASTSTIYRAMIAAAPKPNQE